MLQDHKSFDDKLFEELFTRPSFDGKDRYPTLFVTEENLLMESLAHDFPDIISLLSIGKTFQGRDIKLITLDARKSLV